MVAASTAPATVIRPLVASIAKTPASWPSISAKVADPGGLAVTVPTTVPTAAPSSTTKAYVPGSNTGAGHVPVVVAAATAEGALQAAA